MAMTPEERKARAHERYMAAQVRPEWESRKIRRVKK
jgi:hypothetical protein